jgi:hypothetical protein
MNNTKPDLAKVTGLPEEAIKLSYNDDINTTVLVDYGDAYEVLTYVESSLDENGWELQNNTGTLDTWSEAFHEYVLHLDCHYGMSYEEAHPADGDDE